MLDIKIALVNCKLSYFYSQGQCCVGEFLICYNSQSSGDQCIVRPYDPVTVPDGRSITNEFGCSLLEPREGIQSFPPHYIVRPVSIIHECSATCEFKKTEVLQTVEREEVQVEQLTYEHDWSNSHYCLNIYCIC